LQLNRLPESKRDESDVSRPTDAKQSAQDFPSHPPVNRSIPRELTRSTARIESDDRFVIKDRVSKKCLAIKEHYLLTAREAEIMEYIVRGFTVPSIAAELIISENTVRAHFKHIYTKLDVHKRQELLDLLESI
jgi:DNA-binding NarL/FixJ family response regulator